MLPAMTVWTNAIERDTFLPMEEGLQLPPSTPDGVSPYLFIYEPTHPLSLPFSFVSLMLELSTHIDIQHTIVLLFCDSFL